MIIIEGKKKSKLDLIIMLLCIVVALYFAIQGAACYDKAVERVTESMEEKKSVADSGDKKTAIIKQTFSLLAERLENNPGKVEWSNSTPLFMGVTLFLSLIIFAYIATSQKKYINGKEYGSSEWGVSKAIEHLSAIHCQKREIKNIKKNRKLSPAKKHKKIMEAKEKYRNSDMLFTQTEKICMYNYELNNNTLIIGGSGSGKTRGYVLPNILQGHSSYVITDPKGEILVKSGYFLTQMGYKLRVLNLDEKQLSNGYNPLAYINKERVGWEERVLSLIETIILNTDGGEKKGSSDPFWDKAERLFLQATIFATIEAFPEEERNMNTVMELIRMLKIEEEGDNYDSDLDLFFKSFEETYGSDHIAVQQFREFRDKASGKTAKSIVISVVARLAPFKVKEVKRIFSYDDMHLDQIGEEKTAIFVIVPPIDKTYNFIAGMVFTQMFQELNYCANVKHKEEQKLPVSVRFIMDEFANTCNIPNFVNILSYARSLGIGITVILQSLEQIKNMYKDEWGVIVDNCNTLLFLGGIKHPDTLEYISKLLGKGTFDKKNYSRTKGRQSSSSTSFDKIGRELMDPAEIQKMKKDKCLLFVSGYNPYLSVKYSYKKHKNYKYTSDANKDYTFLYQPSLPSGNKDIRVESRSEDEEKEVYNKGYIEDPIQLGMDTNEILTRLESQLLSMDFDSEENTVEEKDQLIDSPKN